MRCGRRWGKTLFCCILAAQYAIGEKYAPNPRGKYVGYFAPGYKFLAEAYTQVHEFLQPVMHRSTRQEGKIVTRSGGVVDFWSLENEKAGLGRRYHLVVIDEAASTKPNMMDIWEKAIKPTLLDYRGKVIVASNTKGNDPTNFLWRICNEKNVDGVLKYGFVDFHAPTQNNTSIPFRILYETDEAYTAR